MAEKKTEGQDDQEELGEIGRTFRDAAETPYQLWQQLFSGPAPLVGRIGITPYPGVIRLAFGEQFDAQSPTQFRAAVTLTDYSAWELYHLLSQNPSVQFWEKQYQDALKSPPKEPSDGDV